MNVIVCLKNLLKIILKDEEDAQLNVYVDPFVNALSFESPVSNFLVNLYDILLLETEKLIFVKSYYESADGY